MSSAICPICKFNEQPIVYSDYKMRRRVNCARCGEFTITKPAADRITTDNLSSRISGWLRNREGASSTDIPEITNESLERIILTIPSYKVSEKQLLLLRAIEKKTRFPGQKVALSPSIDAPLAWASGPEEMLYLLTALDRRRLLNFTPPSEWEITPEGWDYLDRNSHTSAITNQAFVAMSFSQNMSQAWSIGIKPALESTGHKPYRIDTTPHTDRIDVKIMAEIKNSKFMVADVTEQRPGVYFEAGYALGLGLPVIWSVRRSDLENIHFDTRQYNHIVWDSEEQFSEHLLNFVLAVIGRGN